MTELSEAALQARARRAARRVGLVAMKSRLRRHSMDNYGGFTIVDPATNYVVAGEKFELEPQQVIDWVKESGE